MIPGIITNHNKDKIEVEENYDEKMNIMRIDVREKKPSEGSKKVSKGYKKAKEGLKKLRKLK